VLTLKGQKRLEKNDTVYSERWEGAFERMIPVGQDVDPDKVKASFKSGVLTIRLPKKPEAQRQVKRISIQ
jgi:HSP20 family protein